MTNFGDERLPKRFWDKVQVSEKGCWIWTAHRDKDGYGTFYYTELKTDRAHRIAYLTIKGDIASGLVIDHLCRVRNCVNPEHLEPVTSAENTNRGIDVGVLGGKINAEMQRSKTHCPKGHPYSGENLGVSPQNKRYCKECKFLKWSTTGVRRGPVVSCPRGHSYEGGDSYTYPDGRRQCRACRRERREESKRSQQ